jgi:hypothetical protein
MRPARPLLRRRAGIGVHSRALYSNALEAQGGSQVQRGVRGARHGQGGACAGCPSMDRQAGAPQPAVHAGRRMVNISTLEQRSRPFVAPGPRPRDIRCQTRTPACPGPCHSERADPGERHARPDRRPPSIDRWTGRISTNATSRRQHDGVRRAPEPIRSGRGGAGLGRGGAGTLPRVAERVGREDLPDHARGRDAPTGRRSRWSMRG